MRCRFDEVRLINTLFDFKTAKKSIFKVQNELFSNKFLNYSRFKDTTN